MLILRREFQVKYDISCPDTVWSCLISMNTKIDGLSISTGQPRFFYDNNVEVLLICMQTIHPRAVSIKYLCTISLQIGFQVSPAPLSTSPHINCWNLVIILPQTARSSGLIWYYLSLKPGNHENIFQNKISHSSYFIRRSLYTITTLKVNILTKSPWDQLVRLITQWFGQSGAVTL